DSNTVMQIAVQPDEPSANPTVAPAFRQIIDFGSYENSVGMYAPGQSGWIGGAHYSDLVEPWLNGQYFRAARDGSSGEFPPKHRLLLIPAVATDQQPS
ncbi:MAG: penicillin acylase family protein, partial [Candidatus Promineifilaceae bacterium]